MAEYYLKKGEEAEAYVWFALAAEAEAVIDIRCKTEIPAEGMQECRKKLGIPED